MVPKLYTSKEVADLFGVSESLVMQWAKTENLYSFKVRFVIRFTEEGINHFIKSNLCWCLDEDLHVK